jgi:kynurenine 3-monooxygenase
MFWTLMEAERRVAIVGAGLAGCLLATLLGRRGVPVDVYERRPDPRLAGGERGRSINLAISARGLAALEEVGLREHALAQALPMHGRMIHSITNETSFRRYSADGTRAINSISRAKLNESLLDTAEGTAGVRLCFGHRLQSADAGTGRLTFDTDAGTVSADAEVVLGADGAYSATRSALAGAPEFDLRQDFLEHGYKELTIPPRKGEFALDPDALHIWPRGGSMMIALPNLDRSFTCTLFWPKFGEGSFAELAPPDRLENYFEHEYPDVVDIMPTLFEDYALNPMGSLVTIRCWPWVVRRAASIIALVGDAAHAIVPFFGQGANCAFEDCIEIDRCLSEAHEDWDRALITYQERRKENTDVIADLALDNFVEMRDRVNSPIFQARTWAEHALERRFPGRYMSRYELVSFTTTPYAQIPARIRRQNLAVAGIALGSAVAAGVAVAVLSRAWPSGSTPR